MGLSVEKCRRVVHERAMDVATRILAQRSMTFRVATKLEEARAIEEGSFKRMIAEEDALGAAACLMQNHRFLVGPEKAEDVARKWSRLMCKLGDNYFYDGVDAEEGLRCYQLAIGLDPWNEEGLIEVGSVCVQGSMLRPEEALPYVVLLAQINPERNEFPYIVSMMMKEGGEIKAARWERGKDPGEGSPWPTAGGNARRTGESVSATAPPLTVAWKFDECGGVKSHIVVSGNSAVFGNRAGQVFAVDVRSGKKLWTHCLDGVVAGSAAIQQGRVYLGNSGVAVCLDLETGKRIWKSETGAKLMEDLSEGGGLIANSCSVLCVRGLAVFCDECLAIFDATTGELMMGKHIYLDAGDSAGPCANEQYIFVPAYKKILQISLSSGKMEGPLGTQGKVISGPVVAGELLLHGSNHATLEAILLRTGDPAWSFQTEGESLRLDWVQCRPASSMGRVYFGGPDGIVYALDAKTGKKIWSKSLGGDVETPPVVSGKIIYVSSPDHPLCALSAVDGQVLWTLNQGALGSSMNCSLAPWHGGLLAGGHALYGLKAR